MKNYCLIFIVIPFIFTSCKLGISKGASRVKTFDESGNVVKVVEYDNNKKALKYEQFTYNENGLPNERIIYDAEKSDILKHPIANYTYSYKYY